MAALKSRFGKKARTGNRKRGPEQQERTTPEGMTTTLWKKLRKLKQKDT